LEGVPINCSFDLHYSARPKEGCRLGPDDVGPTTRLWALEYWCREGSVQHYRLTPANSVPAFVTRIRINHQQKSRRSFADGRGDPHRVEVQDRIEGRAHSHQPLQVRGISDGFISSRNFQKVPETFAFFSCWGNSMRQCHGSGRRGNALTDVT